jgi:outer membrane protein OmpA-like peptidoglycan-associated protein
MRICFWLTVAAFATPALAADVDPYRPAASLANGFGSLQVESPLLVGYGPVGGLHMNVAENLLVTETALGNIERTINSATLFTAYGGYVFERKTRVDVFAPIYGYVGVKPLSTSELDSFTGAALGDLRVQALIPIIEDDDGRYALSIIPQVGLPTGSKRALVARGAQAGFQTAVGGVFDSGFGYLANLGMTLAPTQSLLGVQLGSTVDVAATGDFRITEKDRIGFEIDGRFGLTKKPGNSTINGHAFAQKRLESGWGMTVGLGTGFLSGIGAPTVRLFAGVTYALSINDFDRDTLVDREDQCPETPEDADGFEDLDGCPELDNDNDGLADAEDDCPNDPEDYDAFIDEDGCPELDNDNDGIPDIDDRCPLTHGDPTLGGCPDRDGDAFGDGQDRCPDHFGVASAHGCPDADEDGISDFRDRCPDGQPPTDEPREHSDGCPKTAYASLMSIRVATPIAFKERTEALTAPSKKQLHQVFRALKEAQRIELVQILAHTNNEGEEEENMALSQARAEAVMRYLTDMGINTSRLVAKGFGENYPIDTNRTASGRVRNDRIELKILRQTINKPGEIDLATPEEEIAAQKQSGRLSLALHSAPSAHVYVDNKKIAPKAPFSGYKLSPGTHLLWVANPAKGLDSTQYITIIPGHEVVVHIGSPVDDYRRDEHPYGIQFRVTDASKEQVDATEEEEQPVILPWEAPTGSADVPDVDEEPLAPPVDDGTLSEYPSSK